MDNTLQPMLDALEAGPQARIPFWKGDKVRLESTAEAYRQYGDGNAPQIKYTSIDEQ